MAGEALHASQRAGAGIMGNPEYFDIVRQLQESRLYEEVVGVPGVGDVPVMRSHSGPETAITPEGATVVPIFKGGIRFWPWKNHAEGVQDVTALADEMAAKVNLWGYTDYAGGKGLAIVDASALDHLQKIATAKAFATFMHRKELAGHAIDVPAGDVGTNGLSNTYVQRYHELNPNDPYWLATATGKSPEMGGLSQRSEATGTGAYVSLRTIMRSRGEQHASATIQGFGNVGAWFACAAYEDIDEQTGRQRVIINAISDIGGTLLTNHPDGIQVTREMVKTIVENPLFMQEHPEYNGNKLLALASMVQKNQPVIELHLDADSNIILTYPTDYFVPAAMGNVITENNVKKLGATEGVIEAANRPTKPKAHERLVEEGLIVVPDFLANGLGVHTSILEHQRNIAQVNGHNFNIPPGSLTRATERTVQHVLQIAEAAQLKDLRTAAAIASMATLLMSQGIKVDSAFARPQLVGT